MDLYSIILLLVFIVGSIVGWHLTITSIAIVSAIFVGVVIVLFLLVLNNDTSGDTMGALVFVAFIPVAIFIIAMFLSFTVSFLYDVYNANLAWPSEALWKLLTNKL